jgi:ribosomal protein L7/L12
MAQLDPRLQQLPDQVAAALKAGNAVLAIKLLRELKGIGLKEARDLLVAVRDGLPAAGRSAAQHAPLPDDVRHALDRGNKIEAVRLLREKTGLGLKESKDAIERLAATRVSGSPQSAATGGMRPPASASNAPTRPTGLAPGEVPRSGGVLWRVVVGLALSLLAYWFLREG